MNSDTLTISLFTGFMLNLAAFIILWITTARTAKKNKKDISDRDQIVRSLHGRAIRYYKLLKATEPHIKGFATWAIENKKSSFITDDDFKQYLKTIPKEPTSKTPNK